MLSFDSKDPTDVQNVLFFHFYIFQNIYPLLCNKTGQQVIQVDRLQIKKVGHFLFTWNCKYLINLY